MDGFFVYLALIFEQSKKGESKVSEALNKLRQQLDAINDELLRLLNERAAVVREIGEIKEKQGSPNLTPSAKERCWRS